MRLLISCLFVMIGFGQTLGQFRFVDFSAKTAISISGVSTVGGVTTVTTSSPHGYSSGQAIWVYQPWSYTQDETAANGNRGRGYFVITVNDATHYVLASEMFTGRTTNISNGMANGDKSVALTTYYLKQGPRVWLDGPINQGVWNSGTSYLPLDMVSLSGVSYECIAANTNQTPPNSNYWKVIDSSVVGSGTFTASMRNASGKASASHFPYTRAQTTNSTYWGGTHTYDYSQDNFTNGAFGSQAAWLWLASNSSTYYTAASTLVTQTEDIAGGSPACSFTGANCGNRNSSYDVDNSRKESFVPYGALGVLWETLNNTQKSLIADKILNNVISTSSGIEDSTSTNCVNNGYIPGTSGSTMSWVGNTRIATVAAGGLLTLNGLQPGSVILRVTPNYQIIGRVKQVLSDTQLEFENGQGVSTVSGLASCNPCTTTVQVGGNYWFYTTPFGWSGEKTCGIVWFQQHHGSSPRMIPGLESTYSTTFGIGNADDRPNNNRTIVAIASYIHAAMLLGDYDIRAVRLGEQAINYYMTQIMAQDQKGRWSGFTGHGTQYGPGRNTVSAAMIAWVLKNSLTVTPPGILTGSYLQNMLAAYQYATILGKPLFVQPWSTGYPVATGGLTNQRLAEIGPTMMIVSLLYPGNTWAGVTWDYIRNRRGDYGLLNVDGSWGAQIFLNYGYPFYDPLATQTNPSSQALQVGLFTADTQECIDSGLYCRIDTEESVAVSQTGWASNDTQVMIKGQAALPIWMDDNYGDGGTFTIVKNNGANTSFLLGGNGLGASGLGYALTPASGISHGSGLSVWNSTTLDQFSQPLSGRKYMFARMDRWAGNSFSGVADNSYVYARVNLTPSVREASSNYASGSAVQKSFFISSVSASDVTREIIHAKSGSGNQDYVIVYDRFLIGQTGNQLRSYWHMVDSTPFSTTPQRHTEWVTYDGASKSVSMSIPSKGRINVQSLTVTGSANSDVAMAVENYAAGDLGQRRTSNITNATCSGGLATITLSTVPYGNYALPTDGSVSITVASVNPSGYNGTFPITGYTASPITVSYALTCPGGSYVSGGIATYPPWCSYVTAFNVTAGCQGNWRFVVDGNGAAYPLAAAIYPATYRTHTCASSDGTTCSNAVDAEFINILQPSTSTATTMPSFNNPACTATGGTCLIKEILDPTYPKVVVMARKGASVTAMSGTTIHSGTAQYIFTGLAAGSYTISKDGTPISTNTIISSGDTSTTINSTSGLISVTQTGTPSGLLVVSPLALNFTCTSAGSPSTAQNVSISASGVTLTNWSAVKTQSWLTLTPSSGIAAGTMSVSINTCPGTGSYSDTITVSTSDSVGNSPQIITVSLTQYSAPNITTTTLPDGTVNTPYSQTLLGSGGLPPYSWSIVSGSLCTGLTLSSTGNISGTPTVAQTCNFTARLTDAQPVTTDQALSITINSGAAPNIQIVTSPTSLTLSCIKGSVSVPPTTITFTSTGGTLTDWAIPDNEFLNVNPPNGTAAANFTVVADCANKQAGIRHEVLRINSNSANNSPYDIPVTINIFDIPAITLRSVQPRNLVIR